MASENDLGFSLWLQSRSFDKSNAKSGVNSRKVTTQKLPMTGSLAIMLLHFGRIGHRKYFHINKIACESIRRDEQNDL